MKNKKSIFLIIAISIFVGLLHFLIGPNYQGIYRKFISEYLLDILLPLNVYLLLQISIRKKMTIFKSRIIGAISVFLFGTSVEILQLKGIHVFGSTYDFLDIVMYGIGVFLGLIIDLLIIDKYEKSASLSG